MKRIDELFEYTNPETHHRIIIPAADITSLRYWDLNTYIETVSGHSWWLRTHASWSSAYLELEELKDAIFS